MLDFKKYFRGDKKEPLEQADQKTIVITPPSEPYVNDIPKPSFGSETYAYMNPVNRQNKMEQDFKYLEQILEKLLDNEWMIGYFIRKDKVSFIDLIKNNHYKPVILKAIRKNPEIKEKLKIALSKELQHRNKDIEPSEAIRWGELMLKNFGY